MKKFILETISSQWNSYRSGTFLGPIVSPISVAITTSKNFETPIQLPSVKTLISDHKARTYAEIISEFNNFRISQESSRLSPLSTFPLCNKLISVLSPFSHDPVNRMFFI